MNLWGVTVTEKTEQRVAIPEDRDLLITRLSLGPEKQQSTAPTVVWLINHDREVEEKYVLGTLRQNTCEQFEVDVNIAAESEFSLKVTGPGTIYFVGYFNKLPSYDSYSDFDEDIPSDEDGSLEERIRAYMGGDDSSGEDYDDQGNVEELSPSDSDIDVEDEKAGMKSPVKVKQLEHIQPKPQEQKPQQSPQADGEKKKKKKKKNKQPGQPGQPGQPAQQNKPQGGQQNKPQQNQPGQKNPNQNAGDQQKKKNKKNKKRKDGEQGGNPNKKQKTQ